MEGSTDLTKVLITNPQGLLGIIVLLIKELCKRYSIFIEDNDKMISANKIPPRLLYIIFPVK